MSNKSQRIRRNAKIASQWWSHQIGSEYENKYYSTDECVRKFMLPPLSKHVVELFEKELFSRLIKEINFDTKWGLKPYRKAGLLSTGGRRGNTSGKLYGIVFMVANILGIDRSYFPSKNLCFNCYGVYVSDRHKSIRIK